MEKVQGKERKKIPAVLRTGIARLGRLFRPTVSLSSSTSHCRGLSPFHFTGTRFPRYSTYYTTSTASYSRVYGMPTFLLSTMFLSRARIYTKEDRSLVAATAPTTPTNIMPTLSFSFVAPTAVFRSFFFTFQTYAAAAATSIMGTHVHPPKLSFLPFLLIPIPSKVKRRGNKERRGRERDTPDSLHDKKNQTKWIVHRLLLPSLAASSIYR